MSIRWQIGLALALVATVVGAAAGAGAYLTTDRDLRSSVDESLASVASRLADQRGGADGDHGERRSADSNCPDSNQMSPATALALIARDGTVTSCLVPSSGDVPVPGGPTPGFRTESVGAEQYRVLVVEADDGYVQVGRSLAEVDAVLGQLRLRILGLIAGGVLVAAAAGWIIARGISRPIIRLRDTAEAIAATGDLETAIAASGPTEVASLGRSFTSMVGALSISRAQQRRLVDDASHEMRTPLTSLTSNLEHLDHFDRLPAEERAEVLDAVKVDVHELTNLLTELVELATDRADDEEPEALSLDAVARDVAQRAARRSGRTINVMAASGRATVMARPHLVERAIGNLLDNAVKYAPSGDIEVTVTGGRLEVLDHGPGIAPEDRDHVFDRFYRATAARTESGSGLGLSIVRQIVEGHQGTVWAGPRPDGPGAAVGFELPSS